MQSRGNCNGASAADRKTIAIPEKRRCSPSALVPIEGPVARDRHPRHAAYRAEPPGEDAGDVVDRGQRAARPAIARRPARSEEHQSELQSLMRISYAVLCLKKNKKQIKKAILRA